MGSHIFIIEDNLGDVDLLAEACREIGFAVEWTNATNGAVAIELLEHLPPGAEPALILLDLNLPKLSGSEVLVRLKAMRHLAEVPVVILTSSTSTADRNRCRQADGFLLKSGTWSEFLVLAQGLRRLPRNFLTALR